MIKKKNKARRIKGSKRFRLRGSEGSEKWSKDQDQKFKRREKDQRIKDQRFRKIKEDQRTETLEKRIKG